MDTRGPAVDELLAQYDSEQLAYMVVGLRVEAAYLQRLASTWEIAALAAISERLDEDTATRVGDRMREIVALRAGTRLP